VTARQIANQRTLKLISWNVLQGGGYRLAGQVEVLGERKADVVALQEVTARSAPLFHDAFLKHGLGYVIHSFQVYEDHSQLSGPRRYGLLIASRWPLRMLQSTTFHIPWPERVLSVKIRCPWGPIDLHTTHIPTGASHDVIRVETLEGIHRGLARRSRNLRILCGDLNTPREESAEGEVMTWGQRRRPNGDVVFEGGRGERSDRAERQVISGLARYGLIDVFRALHGYGRQAPSWYWHNRGREGGYRLDHVLASAALNATHCEYVQEWRVQGLSDHAAMEVHFEPQPGSHEPAL
jgi:exonuclease III